jgi:hypothetical protein
MSPWTVWSRTSRPSHFLKSACFLFVLSLSQNSLGLGLRGWFLVESAKLLTLIPNMMVSGPRPKCFKLSFAVRTLEFGLRSMQTYKFPSIPLYIHRMASDPERPRPPWLSCHRVCSNNKTTHKHSNHNK